jgi:hypothetical protein
MAKAATISEAARIAMMTGQESDGWHGVASLVAREASIEGILAQAARDEKKERGAG